MSKEYIEELIVTIPSITDMENAQREIYMKGFIGKNQASLADALGPFLTVLGVAFYKSTPVSLATSAVSLFLTINDTDYKKIVRDCLINGYISLGDLRNKMSKLSGIYTRFAIKVPFLEFTEKRFRIVSGFGIITKGCLNSGHWEDL